MQYLCGGIMEEKDIKLEHVTKKFGDFVAVDDISFSVKKGKFFSLLGPSGCGKTTALRMIAGLEKPTKGKIYIGEEDVGEVPPFERPCNLFFQTVALFPHMDVFENIAFGLKMKKLPKCEIEKRVKELLDVVELPGFEKRRTKELSGGQVQRVGLARALARRPRVLLLDEPLGPLDLKLREEMMIELKRIQKVVGTTFIYVTHDQGEAITMSDEIAVMKDGRLIQIGSTDELYNKPRTAFVAEFIGRSNLIQGRYHEGKVSLSNLSQSIITGPHKVVDNDYVAICLKPQRILIGEDLANLDNIFDAVIEEVYFQGAQIDYRVLMEGNYKISILEYYRGRIFEQGKKVKIGWKKEDVWLSQA